MVSNELSTHFELRNSAADSVHRKKQFEVELRSDQNLSAIK